MKQKKWFNKENENRNPRLLKEKELLINSRLKNVLYELKEGGGLNLLHDSSREVVWIGQNDKKSNNTCNYYTFTPQHFDELNERLNAIDKKQSFLVEQGIDTKGLKSFNKTLLMEISRDSNAMEGILDDFDLSLQDFKAKLSGTVAKFPDSENFDITEYFNKIYKYEIEICKKNEKEGSIIILGRTKKHKLKLETVKHYIAYQYAYKCAKSLRAKDKKLTKSDVKNLVLNFMALLAGNEKNYPPLFRNIPVYVNKNEHFDFARWIPVEPERIVNQLDALCDFVANCENINPIVKAAIAQVELVRIHPYFDGNGRLSRIMSNFILIYNDFPCIRLRNKDFEFNSYEKALDYMKAINLAIEEHDCNRIIEMFKGAVSNSIDEVDKCLEAIEKSHGTMELETKKQRTWQKMKKDSQVKRKDLI